MESSIQGPVESLMLIAAQLGLPVVLLFAVGCGLCWANRQLGATGAARNTGGGHKPQPCHGPRCWEIKGCSAEDRQSCRADEYPPLPCWQAAKLACGGRLKAECPDCQLFLSEVSAGPSFTPASPPKPRVYLGVWRQRPWHSHS